MERIISASAERGELTADAQQRLDEHHSKIRDIDIQLDAAARVMHGTVRFRSLGEQLLSVRRTG